PIALRSAARARALFASTGNNFGQCEAMSAESSSYIALGDYSRAEEIQEQTLAILMGLGNGVLTAAHLGNMADLLCLRGKLDLAAARAETGLLLSQRVDSHEATLEALVMLGQVALLRGQLALAEQRFAQAQSELATAGDDPRNAAWLQWHLGELRRAQGQP